MRRALCPPCGSRFENGWHGDLNSAWGQETPSCNSPDNDFIHNARPLICVHFAGACDHPAASCNHLNDRIFQTIRNRNYPKVRATASAFQSKYDDAGTNFDGGTDIDDYLLEPGLSNGRMLVITRMFRLSVYRSSKYVEREPGNDTNGETTSWLMEVRSAMRFSKKSIYLQLILPLLGMALVVEAHRASLWLRYRQDRLKYNAVFWYAALRNACVMPSSSTQTPTSTSCAWRGSALAAESGKVQQ